MLDKRLSTFIFLTVLLLPAFAIDNFAVIKQFRSLNGTEAYINEFMICYARNSTHLNWATYTGGVANITSGIEMNGTFTLSCCDNCYISSGSVVTTLYSLKYDLDTVNITEPTEFNYYVGDILDSLHGVDLSTNDAGFNFDNYVYFIPLIFVIGLGMFLYVILDFNIIGFIIGAVLGLIIGLIYLISVGALSGIYIFIGFLVVVLVVISWTKLKSI